MGEFLTRVWENLLGRVHGPLTFRLILQPLTAAVIATRAGIKDARKGHPAYRFAHGSPLRLLFLRRIYLGESLIVAAVLALLPYPLIRTAVNLLIRCFGRPTVKNQNAIPI